VERTILPHVGGACRRIGLSRSYRSLLAPAQLRIKQEEKGIEDLAHRYALRGRRLPATIAQRKERRRRDTVSSTFVMAGVAAGLAVSISEGIFSRTACRTRRRDFENLPRRSRAMRVRSTVLAIGARI
jgi:hypothetical protein